MTYKSYIDGLRALSILSVVFYHALPNLLPGGYIGVDFFFVISGYLITGILLAKIDKRESFILEFYSRRIKRLFPALIFIFIFCYVIGWFFLLANEFKELNQHIFLGAIFLSNFRLLSDIGYFDQSSNLKPLLHLWSLAIEEQFYFIWPIFLYICTKLGKLIHGILIFTFFSFLCCIFFQYNNPEINFYLPLTRFWELSVGAALFLFEKKNYQIHFKRYSSILIFGLVFLTFSPLFIFNHETKFPGFISLWPISTFLVLFYMTNKGVFVSWNSFLSSNAMIFLGKISYPLYLWHWVVLSFATIIFSELTILMTLTAIGFSFAMSVITFFFIEKPIRSMSNWVAVTLVLLMMVIIGMSYSAYSRDGLEFRYKKLLNIPENFKQDFTKWENKGMLPEGDCNFPFHFPKKKICVDDSYLKDPNIIVMGDSHAFSAYWGLAKLLKPEGYRVSLTGMGACLPYINLYIKEVSTNCASIINDQLGYIASNTAIKNVIFSHRYAYLGDNSSQESFDKLEKSMTQTFDLLLQANKTITYLMPVPELHVNPRLCVSELPLGRYKPVGECTFILESELQRQSKVRESILRVLKSRPTINIYEPSDFICPEGKCSATINGQIVFMDANHLSESGSMLQAVNIMSKVSFAK